MNTDQRIPTITVIAPVYNVAKFLPKCLQTLMDQTFQDFMLIAVNDGSTDNCLEILNEYQEKYPTKITIISQENAGMSIARNTGLSHAKSEYISFVDSDDYLAPTFLEELYYALTQNNADISCCYYYYHFVETNILYKYPFRTSGIFKKEKAMKMLLRDFQIQSLAWNKLYKRSIFFNNDICFPTMAFEDMAIAHKIFSHAEKVVVINRALYFYNQQSASTLATMNAKKINDFILATAMVRVSLDENEIFDDYKKQYKGLTRKTFWCCFYYVLKLHYTNRSLTGIFANVHKLKSSLGICSSKKFDPETYTFELPGVRSPQEFKQIRKNKANQLENSND